MDLVLNEEIELLGQNIDGLQIETQEVDNIILGHVEIDDIYINPIDLDDFKTIQFKMFGISPRYVGDMLRGYQMNDLVERNKDLLNPEFIDDE